MRGIIQSLTVTSLIGAALVLVLSCSATAATPAANSPAAMLAGGYSCYAHDGAYSCFLPKARVSPSLRCYKGQGSDSFNCYAKSALVEPSMACFQWGADETYYLCRARAARTPVTAVPAGFTCSSASAGYVECGPRPPDPSPPPPPTQSISQPPHR